MNSHDGEGSHLTKVAGRLPGNEIMGNESSSFDGGNNEDSR
jgi:hypothetical protein